MGGSQNYGPLLGTLNIRCRIILIMIIGIQKGIKILTTTHTMHGFYLRSNWSMEIGERVIIFQFSVYMLSLLFLLRVLSSSHQKPCVSPMTKKNHASYEKGKTCTYSLGQSPL